MDKEFHQSQWFVYMGDHHEGPFSLFEIQGKLDQGKLNRQSYAWKEGMADWAPMDELEDFKQVLTAKPGQMPEEPTFSGVTRGATQADEQEPEPTIHYTQPEAHLEPVQPLSQSLPPSAHPTHQGGHHGTSRFGGSRKALFAILLGLGSGLGLSISLGWLQPVSAVLGDVFRPIALRITDWVPVMGNVFSLIPAMTDVDPQEFEELKLAAIASQKKTAVALSRVDLFLPTFYVVAQVPDGTRLDVHIVGIPDTLLNQLGFETQTQVYIMNRLGKTNSLKLADQKSLTRGEYTVKVYDYTQKLLTQKNYFLGGAKDSTYLARLSEYHQKIKERSMIEMMELKQFSSTVDAQWTSENKEFDALSKLKSKKGIDKKWNEFHVKWLRMDEQLSKSFSKWTPDVLKNDFFYGLLFEHVLQAGESLQQLHALHHAYMTDAIPMEGANQKIEELKAQVETAVNTLKEKIENAEKLPVLKSGLPTREG